MPDTLRRLDALPITALHAVIVFFCALALSIDTLEVAIGSAVSAIFSAPPYNMGGRALSFVLSALYAGAAVGAGIFGAAAHRWGLPRVLSVCLLWLGVWTWINFGSKSVTTFVALRFMTGISIGGLPPLLIAYLTSIAPPRYRGMFIFSMCAISGLAPPATIFAIRWLTPLHLLGIEGFRWPFAVGGTLAIAVGLCFQKLPESPRWLMAKGRASLAITVCQRFVASRRLWGEADLSPELVYAQPDSPLLAPAPFRIGRRFVFAAVLYGLLPWAQVGFALVTAPVLLRRGYNLSGALLYVAVATFGPPIGYLLSGLVIDRVRRRLALVGFLGLQLATGTVFFVASSAAWTMASVLTFSISSGIYVGVLTTYGAEIFPATVRSSATAAAWSVNRLASTLPPLALLPLLAKYGAYAAAVPILLALTITAAVVLAFGPEGAAGRPVE